MCKTPVSRRCTWVGPTIFIHFRDQRQPGKKDLDHCEYIALVWAVQNPKVQISSSLNGLQLEDNVPFYVEITAEDIVIPITMFSVCNDAH